MEKSNKPLHQAVWSSDIVKIEYYLDEGEDVNEKDENELRPLDIAVMTNNLKVVRLLLERKRTDITVDFTMLYYMSRVRNDEMIPLLFNGRNFNETKNSEGENLLHLAISQGYERMAHRILTLYDDYNINIDAKTRNGFTPLHLAIAHNQTNIFCNLLHESMIDLSEKTVDGRSALHLAVELDNKTIVTMLLEKGADVNDIVTTTGSSALHIAVKNNNLDMVKIILANKGDLMCRNIEGWNSLHIATYLGLTNLVRFFLEKGVDINSLTNDDSSPLLLAIENKQRDVIEILLENSADVSIKNKNGVNPLCASIKNHNFKLTRRLHLLGGNIQDLVEEKKSLLHVTLQYGDLDFAKLLLQKKIRINTRDKLGLTELHLAARCGNADIFQKLLKRGMDVHDTTFNQSTALHFAYHSVGIIEILIKCGMKIDAENEDGDTALSIGAKGSWRTDALELLLKNGANPNHLSKSKVTPLHSAISSNKFGIAKLLIKYGAHTEKINEIGDGCMHAILKYADGCGCTVGRVVNEFLKLGVDINTVNQNGETPLITLLEKRDEGYCNIIEMLMNKGAEITKNRAGESPLHIAIRNKSFGNASLFIEKGLDIKSKTPNGSTPLHYAAQFGNAGIIKLLLNAGLKVDETNRDLKTPLHLAASQGSIEVVQALLDRDSDISKKDKDWNTPLHLAVSRGSLDVVKLLVKKGAFSCHKNLKGFTVYDLADQIENKHIYQCLLLS